jgi:hypothetical protein
MAGGEMMGCSKIDIKKGDVFEGATARYIFKSTEFTPPSVPGICLELTNELPQWYYLHVVSVENGIVTYDSYASPNTDPSGPPLIAISKNLKFDLNGPYFLREITEGHLKKVSVTIENNTIYGKFPLKRKVK